MAAAKRSKSPSKKRNAKASKSPKVRNTKAVQQNKAVTIPQSKLHKMAVRSAVALAMLAVAIATVRAGHIAVCTVVIGVQFAMFHEIVGLRQILEKEAQLPHFRALQWVWFTVAIATTYTRSYVSGYRPLELEVVASYIRSNAPDLGVTDELWLVRSLSVLALSGAFVLTVLSFRPGMYTYQIGQLAWTLTAVVVVVFTLKLSVFCVYEGLIWFLFPATMVVANDTFAYFCGVAAGRKIFNAPFLALSPNKTWEGFLGGAVLTLFYAFYAGQHWGGSAFMRCSYAEIVAAAAVEGGGGLAALEPLGSCENDHVYTVAPGAAAAKIQLIGLGLGLFASFVAPFGGFFASAVKRGAQIKDYGSLFPGHGGFVDRCDCQLIMAVAAWAAYTTFVANPHLHLPVSRILDAVRGLSAGERAELMEELGHLS